MVTVFGRVILGSRAGGTAPRASSAESGSQAIGSGANFNHRTRSRSLWTSDCSGKCMPNNSPSYGNTLKDETFSSLGEKASDTMTHAKEKVSDLGTSTMNKIEEGKDAAAGGLKKAASALHENAGTVLGGDKLTQLAHSAANVLDTTADYVRDNNASTMMRDVKALVKNNPGASMIAVAVVGFMAGRAFSSNRD